MTNTNADRRLSSPSNRTDLSKFPDLEEHNSSRDLLPTYEEGESSNTSARILSPGRFNNTNGSARDDRWQPRRGPPLGWSKGAFNDMGPKHKRQKSLGDAIRTIRTRRGSVSQNAHELADALKAPISIKFTILCLVWYLSSALTNTSSKSILNAYPKPITLTLIQFAFVSFWCVFFTYLAKAIPPLRTAIPALKNGIRYPTREVISTTLPLALFQIGGHILSSTATEKIPVSLVHTIKGLSPLFTVLAYRFVFNSHYSVATYLSLVPLTLGVFLACSVEFSGNLFGILCAFGGALIFVTQNIFSKQLFNEAAQAEADGLKAQSRKLDKLNLLCYCSGLAFILTLPIWLWSDGIPFFTVPLHLKPFDPEEASKESNVFLPMEFLFNGIFHFGQNIIAFILLSLVSPVTYSVASLIKRVFVIVVAIVWFGNQTTPLQAIGIALTFLGLYLYDRTSDTAKADRRAKLDKLKIQPSLLPVTENSPVVLSSGAVVDTPLSGATAANLFSGGMNGYVNGEGKKVDAAGPGKPTEGGSPWLPPGTRQEETWQSRDKN